MPKMQLFILRTIRFTVRLSDKLSKHFTTKLLVKIFFRPKKHKHPKRELPFLNTAETFEFIHDDQKVKGYRWGSSSEKRVLLVHGWEGRATQLHQFIDPLSKNGFEVFAYDGIAHGFSDGKETNMPEMSFLLKHMINTYKIDHIIAHSFGGMATTFAIKSSVISPKSATFVGAPYDIDYILTSFLKLFGLEGKYEEQLIQYVEKKVNLPYKDFQFDTYPKTKETSLLLIHDKNDMEVSFDQMSKFLNQWENVDPVTTEGLGHRRILKDKDIISRICSFVIDQSEKEKHLQGA